MSDETEFPPITWGDPVDHTNRDVRDEPIYSPFEVLIDTREQAPWRFQGLRGDSRRKFRPLVVFTDIATLKTGDYSVKGFDGPGGIVIERKSLADLFGTLTHDRERFVRELERMQEFRVSAVVIEGGWDQILLGPRRTDQTDEHSRTIGKTVFRSILAFQCRYRTQWLPMPTRPIAEQTAFRLMERFWWDREDERKAAEKAAKLAAKEAAEAEQGRLFQ